MEKSNSGQQMWVFWQPPKKWGKDYNAPTQKGEGILLWFKVAFGAETIVASAL